MEQGNLICFLYYLYNSLLISQNIDNLCRSTVIPPGNLNSAAWVGGVYNLAVSNIEGHMVDRAATVGVEYQIARSHLGGGNRSSRIGLGTGMVRQADAEVRHNSHGKSGAVRSVCEAGTSPYIRIAQELSRIACNLGTLGGSASRASLAAGAAFSA